MEVDRREIFRYLGYGKAEPDETVKALTEDCLRELLEAADFKTVCRSYPLWLREDGAIDGGCFAAKSRNLYRNLKDCEEILVFAATLGAGVDHVIQKHTRLQMSRAVVCQAAATALLEEHCDQFCGKMEAEYEKKGRYLRPRFSPGYGDFPLENQRAILDGLEAGKRIGIKLTDSLLMTPIKSITAVMGVSGRPWRCQARGCEVCGKADCAYRRET